MTSTPTTGYVPVPVKDFARFTTLADELGQAARDLAASLADAPERQALAEHADTAAAPTANTIPGIPEAGRTNSRATQAEATANREHLCQQIAATGTHGATTADLTTANSQTAPRIHSAIRTLEAHGRVFRTGHGIIRWYAAEHRTTVVNAMRRRIPNHDLTAQEAADALGLPVPRIREMVETGQLDGRRVGKAIMVHRKGALAYIDTIGAPPTTEPANTPPAA
ncbi:helix-turn-helix domain-containing protein [Nonomuraea sp. JJY05]|uniref:helix-turn-helix domain-containing protein n=1 Tax=Nonomuraea sp. JJY05 TaxID=3350255 RepID=UPI00373E5396